MKIPFLRHFNPITQLFGAYTLFCMGLLLSQLILKLLVLFIWSESRQGTVVIDSDSIIELGHVNAIIFTLLVFIGSSTVFSKLMEFQGQDYLRIRKVPGLKGTGVVILLFLLCYCVSNFLFYVNSQLDPSSISPAFGEAVNEAEKISEKANVALLADPNIWKFLLSLFSVALLTAIGEEFFFRAIVQRLFIKMLRNVHMAVLVSALIFSLMHGNYYGLFSRFFMGVVLGYIFLCTGNLWNSILFHFLNNAIIITFYWLQSRGHEWENISEFGFYGNGRWVALAILAALTVFAFTQLRKYMKADFVQEIKDY